MTIPLTLISFSLAMVIAVAVALVQYAHVPVLRSDRPVLHLGAYAQRRCWCSCSSSFTACPAWASCWTRSRLPSLPLRFNEGAYCAETMRGALESVPQGQLEAGSCVGMTWAQIMRRIVLPQALRTAVPALSNSLIGMIKDTSLASNITVAELFMAGQRVAARTYIFLPHLLRGRRGLPAVLHRHHQAAEPAGAPSERPRLPVRKEWSVWPC